MKFDLNTAERHDAWTFLQSKLEHYYRETETRKTSIYPTRKEVLELLETDFSEKRALEPALQSILKGLEKYAVHTPHPQYFGMFNPRTSFPSILADTISAVYNPQLAAWGHAPFAVEIEHLLIQEFGKKFGYTAPNIDGVFATGGQEAHITAVQCALNHHFPDFGAKGFQVFDKQPVIYCSESSHHATIKAAKVCGLGHSAVQYIEVDDFQRLKTDALRSQIERDIADGLLPFFVFATMGTTGAGAIDPIKDIAGLAEEFNLWLHADAAYGGGVILTTEFAHLLDGIELADSITFDAHKWLSVPMAASLFITRHADILGKTFSISANYMPEEEDERDALSSYTHSIQWSRRFIGLKLYLPLLVFGWAGFDETISHQTRMGHKFRQKLRENGWQSVNFTELPIICFTDKRYEDKPDFSKYIYESFLETGEAWLINYPVGKKHALRVCITNYATTEKHLDTLIQLLNEKRRQYESEQQ